jgi:hypothetical protein
MAQLSEKVLGIPPLIPLPEYANVQTKQEKQVMNYLSMLISAASSFKDRRAEVNAMKKRLREEAAAREAEAL